MSINKEVNWVAVNKRVYRSADRQQTAFRADHRYQTGLTVELSGVGGWMKSGPIHPAAYAARLAKTLFEHRYQTGLTVEPSGVGRG